MDEIIKKCKAGVYLNANKHRDYYESIENAIQEINGADDEKDIDYELAARMVKENPHQFIF